MSERRTLPQQWTWTSLGAVCSKPQYGWTTKANVNEGAVRLLRTTDISKGHVDWDTVPFCTDLPEMLDSYLLREGDIVISRAGSVGVSHLLRQLPVPCVFASYLIRFRPHELVDAQYVAYYLETPSYWERINEEAAGIALANVNARKLEAIELPLAPLAEQRRIVEAIEQQFTRFDGGVAALKRAQAALKRYRAEVLKAAVEGKLTEAWRAIHPDVEPASKLLERILAERRAKWEADLRAKGKDPATARYTEPTAPVTAILPPLPDSWCWATMEMLLNNIESGKNFRCEERPPTASEIGVVKVSAVTWGEYDEEASKTITDLERFDEHILVQPGDFLFSRANTIALVGACVIAKRVSLRVMLSDKILRFRLGSIVPEWALYSLRSRWGRGEIESLATGNQESMRNISQDSILRIRIPLPPLTEQEQIVAEVEQRLSVIAELEAAVEANLKRAERLRQSILERAFSGRLVPQDPNDEPASAVLERIRHEREKHAATELTARNVVAGYELGAAASDSEPSAARQVTLWDGRN